MSSLFFIRIVWSVLRFSKAILQYFETLEILFLQMAGSRVQYVKEFL